MLHPIGTEYTNGEEIEVSNNTKHDDKKGEMGIRSTNKWRHLTNCGNREDTFIKTNLVDLYR